MTPAELELLLVEVSRDRLADFAVEVLLAVERHRPSTDASPGLCNARASAVMVDLLEAKKRRLPELYVREADAFDDVARGATTSEPVREVASSSQAAAVAAARETLLDLLAVARDPRIIQARFDLVRSGSALAAAAEVGAAALDLQLCALRDLPPTEYVATAVRFVAVVKRLAQEGDGP